MVTVFVVVFQALVMASQWSAFAFATKPSPYGSTQLILLCAVTAVGVLGLFTTTLIGSPLVLVVPQTFAVLSLILGTFSLLYWNYGGQHDFSTHLTHVDALYFALGTLTTAGTGDIDALSQTARLIQTLEMAVGFSFVTLALGMVVARVIGRR